MSLPAEPPDEARPPCRRRKAAAFVSVAGGVLVMAYLFHAGIVGRAPQQRDGKVPAEGTDAATACDVQAARETMRRMAQLAGWSVVGDHVAVTWNGAARALPPPEREHWTRSFAAADACLTGVVRRIQFYAGDELVALSAPTSGIWIMK